MTREIRRLNVTEMVCGDCGEVVPVQNTPIFVVGRAGSCLIDLAEDSVLDDIKMGVESSCPNHAPFLMDNYDV